MLKHASAVATINDFLREVGGPVKSASDDPGGYGVGTTHPSKNVDNHTQEGSTGSHAADHEKKIKEEVPGLSVDAATPTPASTGSGEQAKVQTQIGTVVAATGEDPSSETDSAKGGTSDPGSSHPARTDNDDLNGGKFASCSLEQLSEELQKCGNDLLVSLAQSAQAPAAPAASAQSKTAAAAAGTELADLLTAGGAQDTLAVDQLLKEAMAETILYADDRANLVLDFLKAAAEEAEEAAAAGGAEEPAPAPSDAGSAPEAAGGDAEALLGAMGGGGGGDEGALIAQLTQLAQALGMTPEELLAQFSEALAGAAAGGGGGADPAAAAMGAAGGAPPEMPAAAVDPVAAGGVPPEAVPMPAEEPKMAADRRSATSQTKAGQLSLDDPAFAQMKSLLTELAERSRR
jgi:hypothetical protein